VLLIDDQPIVGEMVRRMVGSEPDIAFHYCQDPTQAISRANELQPTVILQDLVMPEIDGLTLVKFLRTNGPTREVPLIVLSSKEEPVIKAEAFAIGANDYLVKLPDKVELLARIRYHSRGYMALQERNEAYRRLAESRKQLADEIEQAAKYVRSLLPPPIAEGPVRVDWRFVPSTELGGDSFGYHWLDDEHLALYLLDVSGHGVGASLMSVTAMNVLGSQALPNVDFRDPGQVLQGLDATFQMEKHDGKYFTIWYGVYRRSRHELMYSGGGHPPALLYGGADANSFQLSQLESQGPMIGSGLDMPFDTDTVQLPPHARLYLYSDGAFEIQQQDGSTWTPEEFIEFLSQQQGQPSPIECVLGHVAQLHGPGSLDDDLSIVQCDLRQG
jgi:sigma-B regulation protein RsbU (phosphoserine phosphatase)